MSTGGCLVPGSAWSRGGRSARSGGAAWSWGMPGPVGVPGGEPPGQLLLRAVRILLECILLYLLFLKIDVFQFLAEPYILSQRLAKNCISSH